MRGQCKLCLEQSDLQLSHIVPAFVFKWLKKEGHIRHAENIDRRVQDGDKSYLLCAACEKRLNSWETQFANCVFHPINADERTLVRYGAWLLKFCVSISWRTLLHIRNKARLNHFSADQLAHVETTLGSDENNV